MTIIKKLTAKYIEAAQPLEVDPEIKIHIGDIYRNDPEYNRFVRSVLGQLKKFCVKFNLSERELANLFVKDLKDAFDI